MKNILNPKHRAEVVDRIKGVQPNDVRRWGTMSPDKMLCHLSDAFQTAPGDREAVESSTLIGRTVLRFIALTAPIPWPKGVQTFPEVNQEIGGTPPEAFRADLDRLLRDLDRFVERVDPSTMRHPIFGSLSSGEWGRWAYRHMDHHARQFGH